MNTDWNRTEEERKKRSERAKKMWADKRLGSPEHRKKCGEVLSKLNKELNATRMTKDVRKKISEKLIGKPWSDKRRAVAVSPRDNPTHLAGCIKGGQTVSAMRFFNKPTRLELAMKEAFEKAGIEYKPQVKIGKYVVDFVVFESIIVEVDGSYWHNRPEKIANSIIRDDFLKSRGYTVVHFTDDHLKKPEECVKTLHILRHTVGGTST